MRCPSFPSTEAKNTTIEILLGDVYESNEIKNAPFVYFINPNITSFSPTSGPATGTNVTLYGSNFFDAGDNNMFCR